MSDNEMKKIAEVIRQVVKEEIEPVSEQVGELTVKVEGVIIPTLEKHTKYFKNISGSIERNEGNIGRLDKRLSETEGKLGIQPPSEFHLIK